MSKDPAWGAQQARNQKLLDASRYLHGDAESQVLPLHFDLAQKESLSEQEILALQAIEIESARTAISSLATLAELGEVDHLGGGLDLISALAMTLSVVDFEKSEYTIEHAHTSIGYYSLLATLGYLDKQEVIDHFRQGIDIAGHVSWVPGGTQLNGGRLGVMIPAAVGQALGLKGNHGDGAWVICHTGDAGWISGQALNGFNGADIHEAPLTFVMHRNGIQLSGSNAQILDKDPRPIVESMGVDIIEIPSLHDAKGLYMAYRDAYQQAQNGRSVMIYPIGYGTSGKQVDLKEFGEMYGISSDVADFAGEHGVDLDKKVWVPGSLMSYRDVVPMLECLFLVNDLPGGKGHHDGSMKGRDEAAVHGTSMMTPSDEQMAALEALRQETPRVVKTLARPAPGSPNLVLEDEALAAAKLPEAGESKSPRVGVEAGYDLVAETYPDNVYIVSCDLNPSTKLGKAAGHLKADHQFEMSIEEQVAAIMVNGLAVSSREPQLNVVSTFAAFYEGIAREAMEMWRYQRNLNGVNEGVNAVMHMSHVGACTGRDHFSGWSLDWITLSLGYLPYLHRFYAPADARAAFTAVVDLAAHYGGHIIGIPRDNLPVLSKQDGSGALYNPTDKWEAITTFRQYDGAKKAILALGAPAYLGEEAAASLSEQGEPTDVYIVNGFPVDEDELSALIAKYDGVVTIEDGIIGTAGTGLRGFASVIAGLALRGGTKADFVGINDPRIAPADGHLEVWEHFGLTAEALVEAVKGL